MELRTVISQTHRENYRTIHTGPSQTPTCNISDSLRCEHSALDATRPGKSPRLPVPTHVSENISHESRKKEAPKQRATSKPSTVPSRFFPSGGRQEPHCMVRAAGTSGSGKNWLTCRTLRHA